MSKKDVIDELSHVYFPTRAEELRRIALELAVKMVDAGEGCAHTVTAQADEFYDYLDLGIVYPPADDFEERDERYIPEPDCQ